MCCELVNGALVWKMCAVCEVWWWVCWWGLVGVGGFIVVCIVLGHVSGCDEGLWRFELGMFVWGVSLVGMHGSGCIVVGVARCELLVLLESGTTLELAVGFFYSRRGIVSGFFSVWYRAIGWI